MEAFVFYFLSALILLCGFLFMTSKKIVHCIFYCFAIFISLAGIFLLLDAPFISAAQVFIYGGAVTVLILFIVMLTVTDIHGSLRNEQSGIALLVVAFFGTVLAFTLQTTKWPITKKFLATGDSLMDLFAQQLFKNYYFPFEMAGILLLAALVGSIYLARERE
jgi:NADH:ubiquinone oxidoreductase subunit 6 (subunit J)